MPDSLVLLTGVTGMVGYSVLLRLVRSGYRVRCAVRTQSSFDRIASLAPTQPYLSQVSSILVPDMGVDGAYDDAAADVTYIIHVASPIPLLDGEDSTDDYESSMLQPAVRGTLNMLEAATKHKPVIKRVVMTGSMSSLCATIEAFETLLDEDTRRHEFKRPFESQPYAYIASKTLAFQAAKDFMKVQRDFELVHVLPAFIIGRDETVTNASQIAKGSNGVVMASLLGHPRPPVGGASVHLDDIAEMHLRALTVDTQGGKYVDFLGCCTDSQTVQWTDAYEIVKRRYPQAVEAGLVKFVDAENAATLPNPISNKRAREVMGIQFKSYEEQVVSVMDHFLELVQAKQ